MNPTTWLMAQASADKSSRLFADLLPWLASIVVFIIVGGVVIYLLRRWLRTDDQPEGIGFTLQDLRDLHACGEMTDAEFAHAREQMIGRLKRPGGAPATVKKLRPPGNSGPASK